MIMSKIVKNMIVATFFGAFQALNSKLDNLTTQTSIDLLRDMFDAIKIGYFDHNSTEQMLKNGKDSGLKGEITSRVELLCTEQALACKTELSAIEDSYWVNEKARMSVFDVTYSASAGLYTLVMGATFKKVRPVIQWVADTQGRMAAWNLVHDEDSLSLFNKAFYARKEALDNATKPAPEASKAEETASSDTDTPPDNGGNTVQMSEDTPDILKVAFKALGHKLAECGANLSKGQQGAVTQMIEGVTNHIDSLIQDKASNTEVTAPKVAVKESAKKVASK